MNKTSPIECECGGYHYIAVDVWDEKSGEKTIAFVNQPTNLWRLVKEWWKHREGYVNDLILSKEQCEELKKLL